jgi:drug/metabolite transporter (DMT)-like permease
MALKSLYKGYTYALLATIAGSTVYIFSKAAFMEVSLPQFGVYWFSMAIAWNALFTLRSAEHRHFRPISRASLKVLVLIGFIEIIATGTFYAAISVSDNPAIPSFMRNMEYIFVTLMGVLLLKERFSLPEVAGIILTISGVMVLSYRKDMSFQGFFTGTAGLMLISTVFYGIRTITAKNHIHTVTPTMLAINRSIFLFVFSLIMLLVFSQGLRIPRTALLNITIGSFLGPFLTSYGQYSALKYIEASRSAIIQSTTALFVILGAYLYFGQFPLAYQVAGGLVTITGAMLLVMGKRVNVAKIYNRLKNQHHT